MNVLIEELGEAVRSERKACNQFELSLNKVRTSSSANSKETGFALWSYNFLSSHPKHFISFILTGVDSGSTWLLRILITVYMDLSKLMSPLLSKKTLAYKPGDIRLKIKTTSTLQSYICKHVFWSLFHTKSASQCSNYCYGKWTAFL